MEQLYNLVIIKDREQNNILDLKTLIKNIYFDLPTNKKKWTYKKIKEIGESYINMYLDNFLKYWLLIDYYLIIEMVQSIFKKDLELFFINSL